VNPADQDNYAIKEAAKMNRLEVVALLFSDPRVKNAPLPYPDAKSKNSLARALAEILTWNVSTQRSITHYLKNARQFLTEYQVIPEIMKYHPLSQKRKSKKKPKRVKDSPTVEDLSGLFEEEHK